MVTPDAGAETTATVSSSTKLLRIAPGEKNLQNATPFQLTDLQAGDRVLVSGASSDDGKSIVAASVVLMKRADVDATHQQQLQDWQKRGLGGLVSAVDPASGTVTITVTGFGGSKNVAVQASKETIIRRYAPDSVKFEDAKTSTLPEIHAGDQLRARGARSADGSQFAADEIVTGSFRNIAGTINSIDASTGILNVQDLLSKKPVQIKVTADSQMRKLTPEMAQRFAMRLKGVSASGTSGTAGSSASSGNSPATGSSAGGGWQGRQGGGASDQNPAAGTGGGMRAGGAPDFQQILSRIPPASLSDLKKGDAVLIVATQGTASNAGTAITLVGGVEPILQASPSASSALMLAPWSLGAAPAGGDAASQ